MRPLHTPLAQLPLMLLLFRVLQSDKDLMCVMVSAESVQRRGRGGGRGAAGGRGGGDKGSVQTKVAKAGAHLSYACITDEEGGGEGSGWGRVGCGEG